MSKTLAQLARLLSASNEQLFDRYIDCNKMSHTFAFEGVNILQNEATYAERYDFGTGQLRSDKSGISLPNLFYRIDF